MTKTQLMPVADALARITGALHPMAPESVSLADAYGRVLAEDVAARLTQPPAAVSAMDGYAVRAADVADLPTDLTVIGEVPAGASFDGVVGQGEAVRIFTGAPVPLGTDTIVIQEDTVRDGDTVTVNDGAPEGRYIRPAGLDFSAGDVRLKKGRLLTARDIGLAAAMNVPWLMVRRKPRIALLATGDEIVRPGDALGPNQIVSSNALALAALIKARGGAPIDLGIARDNRASLAAMAEGARGADMLITLGGASVGDHDLVQSVLGERGLNVDFWRIAMRPGKPLMFGAIGDTPMLGLPGNPVSSLVCGLVFVAAAIHTLLGRSGDYLETDTARLGRDLPENDERQDYLRATLTRDEDGALIATPFDKQDSSMLSRLAAAQALVIRPPGAPRAKEGKSVPIIRIEAPDQGL
ncbi:MAG: molybdopterin molybdotransferase MoeA [Proteobacteria bacterium]|nr:molybdopterin molybdotransferase MoeA [Pseudomonadota bacterium]MDA1060036.1 molybdopterin molybdotransferase MoeA [Pseudomonadota bacterium]